MIQVSGGREATDWDLPIEISRLTPTARRQTDRRPSSAATAGYSKFTPLSANKNFMSFQTSFLADGLRSK